MIQLVMNPERKKEPKKARKKERKKERHLSPGMFTIMKYYPPHTHTHMSDIDWMIFD